MLVNRLITILNIETSPRNRFKLMQDKTGIGKDSWAAVYHGRQRPTAEIIEAAAKLWPEYAFWMTTGNLPGSIQKHKLPLAAADAQRVQSDLLLAALTPEQRQGVSDQLAGMGIEPSWSTKESEV